MPNQVVNYHGTESKPLRHASKCSRGLRAALAPVFCRGSYYGYYRAYVESFLRGPFIDLERNQERPQSR
jgi:hypothetical protein